MPTLSNPKHERFAQELAKGTTADEAYSLAGYIPSRPHASRLATKGNVKKRVAEILGRAAQRAVVTVEDIVRQLDDDREFARQCGSAGAAITATMGKAKVLGLAVDRTEHTGEGGGPIKASIKVTFVKP